MKKSLSAFIVVTAFFATSNLYAAQQEGCTTAREFVTALEFLRSDKEFKIGEPDAQKTALAVAKGCTGAANRFIRASNVLIKAGMTSPDSMKIGLELSGRTDREAETFIAVFKKAYLSENLDLDLPSAVRLARSLSTQFAGDILAVRDDFETVVDYCASAKKLALPKPRCAAIAEGVARAGEKWSGGVGSPFIAAVEFLNSSNGPNLSAGDSVKLAQELIENGPDAPTNFIQSYRYASAEKGLKLQRNEAISFAKEIASYSYTGAAAPAKTKQ